MKNNQNEFNADLHFQTQDKLQRLKEEEAKRQKRLWLRTKIHEIFGHNSSFEIIFEWIYQSPLYEWEGMLYCLKYQSKMLGTWEDADIVLEEAKKLYSLLK